jgi:3-oxoacyl-[acyl-carrier protein] reductase
MKLEGKIALVTGGGSGIGRAIATRFAAEGARVMVNDLREKAARETADAIGAAGGEAHAVAADVSDSGQVAAMFAALERTLGGLDILVNNAGIAEGEPGERERATRAGAARMQELLSGQGVRTHWDITQAMTDVSWRRMLGVHLDGTFFCTRAALGIMGRQDRGGVIINMSSVAALMGLESVPHYSAAKAGILGFTRAVAREVGSRRIRVNAICPGFIDTPMTEPMPPLARAAVVARTPLGRWAEPEEVAATALFLASDDAAFYTGQWLSPNGGLFTG